MLRKTVETIETDRFLSDYPARLMKARSRKWVRKGIAFTFEARAKSASASTSMKDGFKTGGKFNVQRMISQRSESRHPPVRPQLFRNPQLPTSHTPKSGILEALPSL